MKVFTAVLFVISTLAFQEPRATHTSARTSRVQKAGATLSCSPRITSATPRTPATVRASLVIHQPNEKLWCSAIAWYLNGRFQSSIESDCPPYAESQEGESERWTGDSNKTFSLWPGDHNISVRLFKSQQEITRLECSVFVR